MSRHDKHKRFKQEVMQAMLMWEAKVKLLKFQTKQAMGKSGDAADFEALVKTNLELSECALTARSWVSTPWKLEVVKDLGLGKKLDKINARVRYCARKSLKKYEAWERKVATDNQESLEEDSASFAQSSNTSVAEEDDQDMDDSSDDGAVTH